MHGTFKVFFSKEDYIKYSFSLIKTLLDRNSSIQLQDYRHAICVCINLLTVLIYLRKYLGVCFTQNGQVV